MLTFTGFTARVMMSVMAALLLLSFLALVANPARVWFFTLFGLLFIPLLIVNFLLLLWALKRRSKTFVIPLVAILPSFFPLVIGQMTLCTPFVYLQVMPRLQQMDQHLYEAALDLGCNTSQALMKVTLPQIWPAVLSGFMTAITLSLDDYFIATYTKPATFDTISTYVVNATKGSQTEIKTALWALSTIIFVLVVLMTIAANRLPKEEEEL